MAASRKSNSKRPDGGHYGNGASPLKSTVLARLKGLANGVNPKWGTKTVIVSGISGEVIRVEEGKKRGAT
jgi:hypothetical protein